MTNLNTDRNLRLLDIYWFLRDFQLWIPVWIVFLTVDQGFSLTQVTIAEGLFLVGAVLLEVPTGVVADRYGRSTSLGIGAVFLGLAILAFAFTTSFPLLLVSFLTWSLAFTLISGADMALLFDTLKAAGRTGEYERRAGRGIALQWSGMVAATLLGGPVAALIDTRSTIFIGAATCLVTAIVAFTIREVRPEPATTGRPALLGTVKVAFHEIWRQPEVRIVVLLGAATFAATESVFYLVQPYLLDRGVSVGPLFSTLQVPIFVAGAAGALLSGRLFARVGSASALLSTPVIFAAGCALLAFVPGLWAYGALALMATLNACLQPLISGAINRRVSSERRATVLSLYGMGSSLGMAALAPAIGYTADSAGLSSAFLLSGGVAIAALALFGVPMFALRHRFDARPGPDEVLKAPIPRPPSLPGNT